MRRESGARRRREKQIFVARSRGFVSAPSSSLFSLLSFSSFLSSAAAGPAAALSIAPGALSSFRVTGGQQLVEGLQGSAQQCLDACFGKKRAAASKKWKKMENEKREDRDIPL